MKLLQHLLSRDLATLGDPAVLGQGYHRYLRIVVVAVVVPLRSCHLNHLRSGQAPNSLGQGPSILSARPPQQVSFLRWRKKMKMLMKRMKTRRRKVTMMMTGSAGVRLQYKHTLTNCIFSYLKKNPLQINCCGNNVRHFSKKNFLDILTRKCNKVEYDFPLNNIINFNLPRNQYKNKFWCRLQAKKVNDVQKYLQGGERLNIIIISQSRGIQRLSCTKYSIYLF